MRNNKIKIFLISILASILFMQVGLKQAESTLPLLDLQMSLSSGWNFISFPKLPSTPPVAIETLLVDVLQDVRIIWGYDNQKKLWLKYKHNANSLSPNTLNSIELGKGYWIYMDNPATLVIRGSDVSGDTLTLHEGWNLIGYNWADNLEINKAFANIKGKWDVIWSWKAGIWKVKKSPDIIAALSAPEVTTLNKGRAYWVKIRKGQGELQWMPDTTIPTIVSSNPASNAIKVPTDSSISVTFGEEIDPLTINTATFLINGVSGTITYSEKIATFKPLGNLAYSTSYTATITTDVTDLAGNPLSSSYSWTFTTPSLPDTNSPTIISKSPANEAKNVSITSSVAATFSEDMDSSTINNSTFTVSTWGNTVSGALNYNPATRTATFTPAASFAIGATYSVVISMNSKDLAGNSMISNHTWTFTAKESVSGIWTGTFYTNVGKKTVDVTGVITENGEGRFLSDEGGQYEGNVSVDGDRVTSTLMGYALVGYVFPNGSSYGAFQLNGTVKTKTSFTGTYSGAGDSGTFTLTYDKTYERGSSLSLVSGSYANSDPYGNSQHLTINANGTFSGYNSYGCTFTGKALIINSSYDAYRLSNVYISSCGVLNGTYNGLGVLRDYVSTNDMFIMGISNNVASLVIIFKK